MQSPTPCSVSQRGVTYLANISTVRTRIFQLNNLACYSIYVGLFHEKNAKKSRDTLKYSNTRHTNVIHTCVYCSICMFAQMFGISSVEQTRQGGHSLRSNTESTFSMRSSGPGCVHHLCYVTFDLF